MAILGLAAVVFGFGVWLGGDWTSPSYEQTGKPHASAKAYAAAQLANTFAAYPIEDANACYGAKNHDSADLCAQWRAAIAAEKAASSAAWANRLSVIGAFLTLVGTAFVYWTFRETRRTADAAFGAVEETREGNRISRQSQRPWLTYESIQARIYALETSDYLRVSAKIDLEIKNTGDRPALNVSLMHQMKRHIDFDHTYNQSQFGFMDLSTSRNFVKNIAPHATERLSFIEGCLISYENAKVEYGTLVLVTIDLVYHDGPNQSVCRTGQSFVLCKDVRANGELVFFYADELVDHPVPDEGEDEPYGWDCKLWPVPSGSMT